MSRFRKVLFGTLALAIGLLAIAWYQRPIRQARLIGLDWRATTAHSNCTLRLSDLWCTSDTHPIVAPYGYTTLRLDPIRRSVLRFDRVWEMTDSTEWRQRIDSIRHSFAERHAEPLPCDTTETRFPIAQAWDVGAGEARLYAAQIPPRAPEPAYWFLDVLLVPHASAGCGPTWRYVRLTPAQAMQRAEDWVEEQLGF
jgi:hypothetical protein